MKKEKFSSRFKKAWNVFFNKDPTVEEPSAYPYGGGFGSGYKPDRVRLSGGSEKSIVGGIYARISIDSASMNVRHVKVDENDRFVEYMDTALNYCLSVEANADQTGRSMIQDAVLTMLETGSVAIVPARTEEALQTYSNGVRPDEIYELRAGKIVEWFPKYIRVELYNEVTGQKQEVPVPKDSVAIVENPFYTIMNEYNSILQRLIRKLNLLDQIDGQNGSNKLDLLVQMPYSVKTDLKRKEVDQRRRDLEYQLTQSRFGIGWIDSTEHVIQLNRAVENNLLPQIEYLTNMVYGQLGITPEILNGTADEQVMKNYLERTISPIMLAITEEMERKFLTKTGRTQNQAIQAFNDPFRMVTPSQIAEMADKLTRNEILTSNEVRKIFGIKPSDDPTADELRNKNLNQNNDGNAGQVSSDLSAQNNGQLISDEEYQKAMTDLDTLDEQLYDLSKELKHYASPYYDPVKAHEYYERTKQLKGRSKGTSTAKLNDEGKAAANYVKKSINSERDQKIQSEAAREKSEAETKISVYSQKVQQKIESIRAQIKDNNMMDSHKEHLRAQIADLRNQNKLQRAAIQAVYKTNMAEIRANTKEEYASKYADELAKIMSDPDMTVSGGSSGSSAPKISDPEYRERLSVIENRNDKKITEEQANSKFEELRKKYKREK